MLLLCCAGLRLPVNYIKTPKENYPNTVCTDTRHTRTHLRLGQFKCCAREIEKQRPTTNLQHKSTCDLNEPLVNVNLSVFHANCVVFIANIESCTRYSSTRMLCAAHVYLDRATIQAIHLHSVFVRVVNIKT